MARALVPCKAPIDAEFSLFSDLGEGLAPKSLRLRDKRFGVSRGRSQKRTMSWRPHIYILLCMFNGFAFARPLCGAIKVIVAGLSFKLTRRVRWGSRTRGSVCAGSGDDTADGVNQQIYFPHNFGCVPRSCWSV